jgi:hypothetical protein
MTNTFRYAPFGVAFYPVIDLVCSKLSGVTSVCRGTDEGVAGLRLICDPIV